MESHRTDSSSVVEQHEMTQRRMNAALNKLPRWPRPVRSFRISSRLAAPVFSAALLAACSGDGPTSPGDTSTVTGTWEGTTEFLTPSGNETWQLSLTQDTDGAVSGTYRMTSPEWGSISSDVVGDHDRPSLSLSFSIQFRPSSDAVGCWFSGTVAASGQRISGRVSCWIRADLGSRLEVSGPLELARR